jgi:hypothetical protein
MRHGIWAVALLVSAASGVRADEADAVDFVKQLGGHVERDENAPDRPVTALYLSGPQVTDAVLRDLPDFKELRHLRLIRTQVTNDGLKELKRFKQLRTINFCGTRLTDAGLKELKEPCRLEAVYLYGSRLTEKGLDDLRRTRPDLKIYR